MARRNKIWKAKERHKGRRWKAKCGYMTMTRISCRRRWTWWNMMTVRMTQWSKVNNRRSRASRDRTRPDMAKLQRNREAR